VPDLVRRISPFSRELTALLVEDDAVTRRGARALLKGVFKEVILAADGKEGLAAFRARAPQLVLTDHLMPELSGLDMIEAIRAEDSRVPIIFITAAMDTELLVRAINLGIAAIVPKPLVRANLFQAVGMVVGLVENEHLQRRNLEQELALLQFREKYHEFQQELAFRKELSILENDFHSRTFSGPAPGRGEWLTQVVYSPHDIMCGDSYSLRRLEDGGQLVFLADAMGKGLAAALTSSMSAHTFNLLVDALCGRFRFQAFVAHYLEVMGKRLLEDEVFSFTLAWLPDDGPWLELAAFGMPPLLVGEPGRPVRKLRSNNPPLSGYGAAPVVTRHDLGPARTLLLYTDGLNEAPGPDGGLYRERLDADFATSACRDQLWSAFRRQVPVPGDDVTFLFLARVDAAPAWEEVLTVPGRLGDVERAGTALEDLLATRTGLDESGLAEFSMAFREALINAYEHGSLGIPFREKRRLLEEGLYFEHLLETEAGATHTIKVVLALLQEGGNSLVKLTIEDEGPGFTPLPPQDGEAVSMAVSGRGLKMMRRYSDALYFNEKGNSVTLLKVFRGASDATGPI